MELSLTSKGIGVQLFRRQRLEKMKLHDFPPDHPIHRNQGYLVQRFVDTGPNPSFHRVQTFFGKVIYSWHSTLQFPRCPLDAPDEEIERTIIASQGGCSWSNMVPSISSPEPWWKRQTVLHREEVHLRSRDREG